ncbi:MAG: GTPase Era [Omnitrophica WOR_2 bacterium RIFCSPHIGHO2_02_FULL_68_15]|nr:MAG: GTPase Era [Omnitrophica WOR_2 bacterium RIFCSPHIGHO2_02_FULL_68_15]
MTSPTFRCGTAAILGRPNVGKSTLLNVLLGQKLAIVSSRPGTTRDRILGVLTRPQAQILFLDTPGFGKTETLLDKRLLHVARQTWAEADVLVIVTAANRGFTEEDRRLIEELGAGVRTGQSPSGTAPTLLLAINKIDTVAKPKLLPQMAEAAALGLFDEIVPISAATGDGVDPLRAAIIARLPADRALFPADQLTDRSTRFLASELIREQVLHVVRQELPHAVAVQIEDWIVRRQRTTRRVHGHERRGPSIPKLYLRATLIVERPTQKAIVVGAHGERLKAIGTAARAALETLVGQPVYLDLWVKVWPDWRGRPQALKSLGY